MRLLLFAFGFFFSLSPGRAHDGKGPKDPEEEKQDRLVGASESPAWGHPYTVYFMAGDVFQGMGVIIDPYTILTDGRSARFLEQKWSEEHRAKVLVLAGKFAQARLEPEEQWREICSYVRHPDYHDVTKVNCYAIVSLYEPFTMNQYVNNIPLAPPDFVPTQPCVVAARGSHLNAEGGIKCLKQVVVEKKDCPSAQQHQTTICTGRAQCHNDDGGPLVCQHGSRVVLAGIVAAQGNPCDTRTHSIYANIATLPRSWLQQEINKAKKICRPPTF